MRHPAGLKIANVLAAFVLIHQYASTAMAIPAASTLPTATTRPVQAFVYDVSPLKAGLKDHLTIRVTNLEQWIQNANQNRGDHAGTKLTAADLIPVINGIKLNGIHPESIVTEAPRLEDVEHGIVRLESLQFLLVKNDANKQAWNDLLNHPVLERSAPVTVAFETAGIELVHTEVHENPATGFPEFKLIVVRTGGPLVLGILVMVGSLIMFLHLATDTTLIRDTTSDRRPDGKFPFSLARTQMAFWFFLVIGSYFLLWAITGDQDTITSSALVLIGISAGTAFGAAVVDAGKTDTGTGYRPPINPDPIKILPSLRAEVVRLAGELQAAQQALNDKTEAGKPEPELLEARRVVASKQEALARTKDFIDFFNRAPWRRIGYDLLGDNGNIGFHRFQVAVSTLVLGIVFVTQIYNELSMPNFSNTLLGLMGISAGTYIGFKIPEGRR